jgi:hypothetical protein
LNLADTNLGGRGFISSSSYDCYTETSEELVLVKGCYDAEGVTALAELLGGDT